MEVRGLLGLVGSLRRPGCGFKVLSEADGITSKMEARIRERPRVEAIRAWQKNVFFYGVFPKQRGNTMGFAARRRCKTAPCILSRQPGP